ncbi:lipocalin-like domain-containing protein [Aquimarina mytili]|uniref:Lipocalin family protein n=1 Tax=Aquimarina mytili TaxID=874423 RepID=A0A936ZXL5_9FLAO|nr:lipocalin family protein [Aquimarina mytili]MBL0683813.1 lipocalin family protein [Aquimarina mytili]
MKKLGLIILLISATFTSCSSDDDAAAPPAVPTNETLIAGTWELTARKELGVDRTLDNCELTSTIQFNADKTYTEKTFVNISNECASDGEFVGTWAISGETITLIYNDFGTPASDTPKFSISSTNDVLVLTFDELEDTYKKK